MRPAQGYAAPDVLPARRPASLRCFVGCSVAQFVRQLDQRRPAHFPNRSPATGIIQAAGVLPDPPNLRRQQHSLRSPQLLVAVARSRSLSPRAPALLLQNSETPRETIRVFAPPAPHDRSVATKKTFHPTRPADSSHPAPPRVKRKPRDTPAHQPTLAAVAGRTLPVSRLPDSSRPPCSKLPPLHRSNRPTLHFHSAPLHRQTLLTRCRRRYPCPHRRRSSSTSSVAILP